MNKEELQAARSGDAFRRYLDMMQGNLNEIRYKQVIQQVAGEILSRAAVVGEQHDGQTIPKCL